MSDHPKCIATLNEFWVETVRNKKEILSRKTKGEEFYHTILRDWISYCFIISVRRYPEKYFAANQIAWKAGSVKSKTQLFIEF